MMLFWSALPAVHYFGLEHWRYCQWIGFSIFLSAMLAHFLLARYGIFIWLTAAITAMQGLYIAYFGNGIPGKYVHGNWASLAVLTLLVGSYVASRPLSYRTENLYRVGYLGLINAMIMIFSDYTGPQAVGMFGAVTVDSSFVAATYPLLVMAPSTSFHCETRRIHGAFLGPLAVLSCMLPLIAIYLAGGSTAVISLFLAVSVALIAYDKLYAFTMVVVGVLVGILLEGDRLLDPANRVSVWVDALGLLWERPDKWLTGFGIGTWESIYPIRQAAHGQRWFFLYAHNEYVQVLFETGVVGLLGLFAVIYRCLKNAWSHPWLLSTCVAYLTCCLTQGVFRYFAFQALGLAILLLCEQAGDEVIERARPFNK